MRRFVAAFAGGLWLAQQQATLFSGAWLLALFGTGLVLLALARKNSALAKRRWLAFSILLPAGLVLGFAWAQARGQWRLADELPAASEGREIVVSGIVSSLPQTIERGVRFEFDVETASETVPRHVSLAWYQGEAAWDGEAYPAAIPLHAGERWRFTVRLKRPHGNVNPQGFDYEGWLLERNIRATGYVRPQRAERLDAAVWRPGYAIEMLRETLRERFQSTLGAAPYAGILVALAIGDQQAIAPELWQIFAKTGITHLMSISGLHVTMFAGLAYLVASVLWRRSARLPLRMPAQKAGALAGFLAALAYSLLSGFAVPAQRTLYMLGVVALARLLNRELAVSRVLALALFLVLLLDPWAVLAAGFWLSFGAVALLFHAGSGRLDTRHWLSEWGRTQWAVTLGMLPAVLALFGQFSLVSPLANALAIPLVSFVITPLALAGTLPLLSPLLEVANFVTAVLMRYIEWLAAWPLATWQQAIPPAWALLVALAGGLWLLLPRGFPARWLGVFAFLPLLTYAPPRPALGEARVVVLDVGQGLAVHVQTAAHDLLFDAGPKFSSEADSGNRLIVPYLRAIGVRRLNALVISHADKDHEGGAESVLGSLPVERMITSLPFTHPLSAWPVPQKPCQAGDEWRWDGVRFAVLHPLPGAVAKKTNAVACVLLVEAGDKRLLITSDIEAAQELELVEKFSSKKSALVARRDGPGETLHADVVTVPHHGSRTSSTPEFIAAVGAREAIFPVGYRNRYGHPKDAVAARWQTSGAHLSRTDLDGAVSVRLGAAGITLDPAREARRRYWFGR
ncbi:MAG: DNA internalization-related competence protein ComEC/Rec2 [Betaproteobacteria bacterium HGW-Betaproteobacteria-11]|nr:MAG: DNA internalization-related competence protein ComEC/Rec2 [Betaproteobacteria bacterium HGW-Betaproteobacteria-11]